MLRASSLGLRCYRPTLHRGVLRCSLQASQARTGSHSAAAQTTPSPPDARGRMDPPARVQESPEVQSAMDESEGDRGAAGVEKLRIASRSLKVPDALHVGGAAGSEPQPTQSRVWNKGARISRASKYVAGEDEEEVRRAFEKNLPEVAIPPARSQDPFAGKVRGGPTKPPKRHGSIPPLEHHPGWSNTPPDDVHRETRAEHLYVLATTQSVADAWKAYAALMSLPPHGTRIPIPYQYLHRLARLIAVSPRTRALFLRLLSVISTIHRTGGTVHLWQWNVLIDFAGKGWRKLTPENFKTALDVYHDLISNKAPGAAFSKKTDEPNDPSTHPSDDDGMARLEPDIVTLTTLLDIATSTLHKRTVRHAQILLENSGQPLNRITYLVLLRYQSRLRQLFGVQSVLAQMAALDLDLGIDGLNACIWAFGSNNRLPLAESIYKVLRANLDPDPDPHIEALRGHLAQQSIRIPHDVKPDHITYTALIQAYAYRGHLNECLTVFMDFVSSIIRPGETDMDDTEKAKLYMPAYRAIFLGFARYGQDLRQTGTGWGAPVQASQSSDWTLDVLDALFHDFLRVPYGVQPSERLVYWILSAFAKTSGDDKEKLRTVYSQLEERFGGGWRGRLADIKRTIYTEESLEWENAEHDAGTTDY